MTDDNEFTPRLGRSRTGKGARGRNYLHRVLQGIAREGGLYDMLRAHSEHSIALAHKDAEAFDDA